MNDLKFALRQLQKSPGFTVVAVLTLALGIGANTAIFSVVNAVLLKPLPFPSPDRLVAIGSTNVRDPDRSHQFNSLSYPDFFDFRNQNRTFDCMSTYRGGSYALVNEQGAQNVQGLRVSAEFFDVLGVEPAIGRAFVRADEQAGGGPGGLKAILTHDLWMRLFNGDKGAIGRTLRIQGQSYTIIGIMPRGFQFPFETPATELYVTLAADAANADGTKPVTEQRGNHMLLGFGRLKQGVTVAQANADLGTIAAALEKQYPDSNTGFGAAVVPLRDELVGDVRTALYVLFGAVVCVLLIANANVANLMLARASVRAKEIALRAALGASRRRIIRQLLTESLLLAGIGGLLGLLIAKWGTDALIVAVPQNIPRIGAIELDSVVLAFTLLVSMGTGIVFGLVPAWHASHVDLNSALKTGARIGTGAEYKHRLRNGLVMGEIVLALILLVCAGLLIQTFARLSRVKTGLRTENLFTARVSLPDAAYPRPVNVNGFFDQLLAKVRAIPGINSASIILPLPLTGSHTTTDFDIEEHPMPEGQRNDAPIRIAGVDYFQTMGIPLSQGRVFKETDKFDSLPVVIVNERFAEKFFPGQNVIGKRIKPGWSIGDDKPKMREIVGVVGNVKHLSLQKDFTPEMYVPASQVPVNVVWIVARTSLSNPTTLTAAVRDQLASIDRDLPLTQVRVFNEYMARTLAKPRFNALLLSVFAGTALLLTAIGIYGLLAYSVSQRTNEIGIRIALGAAQSNIFRLVVGQAMLMVAISIAIGLLGAFMATRLLGSLLYGVATWDPTTFASIATLIAVVAFLACWLPARRAARVDPVIALRAE
ncbi:MAG TPA: ABC transporter permease [Candidatus Udaeobacter sp.]|nr:ABC transporter permease [Candidatus Udaeobacter sp.]